MTNIKFYPLHKLLSIPLVLILILFVFEDLKAQNIKSGFININTEPPEVLKLLPGVGEKISEKIILSRRTVGLFSRSEELYERKLMYRSNVEKIQHMIIFQGESQFDRSLLKGKKKRSDGKANKITDDENIKSPQKKAEDTASREPLKFSGDIVFLPDESFYDEFLERLNNADEEVWLCTFVFKSSGKALNKAEIIIQKLIELDSAGVDVNIILEYNPKNKSLNKDNNATARKLKAGGVNVYRDHPKKTMHSKIAVVDKRYVFIGSHNMTHSALYYNNEISLEVDSPEMAAATLDYLKGIVEN